MSARTEAPRGHAFEGGAAGRRNRALSNPADGFYPKRRAPASERGQAIVLTTPQGRRIVGRLATDGFGRSWLEKCVDPAKHLHRRFDAWGCDAELLDSLEAQGVYGIRCHLTDGTTEEAGLDVYREHGIRADFGYGPQVFLPRRFFVRHDSAQPTLALEFGTLPAGSLR